MQATEKTYSTPEEYLEIETQAEYRSEYYDGEVVPMAGGSPNHNQIALNLSGALNFALRRQPYRVFMTDLRLWIPRQRIYTYPDVMVVAGNLEFAEGRKDTITNPLLIMEVLSKSTNNFDRGEKFEFYRTIPSFQEYILIDQTKIHVEQFAKTADNKWLLSEYEDENALLALTNIQFEIPLVDIYSRVEFNEG
ncbi:MAG TPA: Uma2 family endonuclease [Candidatus Sericytochromatia bacterium]